MFRVLIVDDEPSAVDYIRSIIRLKCPGLEVAATAEDGQEGLRKFRECRPDLIVSDVKMPVMDGLEMTKAIKQEDKKAQVLLISGYAEFEYARTALKYGVSDYMLKPVTPANFVAAIAPVLRAVEREVYERRKTLVRSMIAGEPVSGEAVCRYFPEGEYFTAVVREGGLPRRFAENEEKELISEEGITIFVYGRDERESLFICPKQAVGREEFHRLIGLEEERRQDGGRFTTTVLSERTAAVEDLARTVEKLYKRLHSALSIGVTQRLSDSAGTEAAPDFGESLDALQHYLNNQDYGKVLEGLAALLKRAEEVRCPQLQLERTVRQIISAVRRSSQEKQEVLEEERMFEDAFYYAENSAELFESLRTVCTGYWKTEREAMKVDSAEFVESILQYVREHFAEELTVSSVCRRFGLSPSYLNLLFRKNRIESFNVYLRNLRIARARQLMTENPQIFIKDVAALTGYKDQFYFSRVFRAVTGVSPSQFAGEGDGKKGSM